MKPGLTNLGLAEIGFTELAKIGLAELGGRVSLQFLLFLALAPPPQEEEPLLRAELRLFLQLLFLTLAPPEDPLHSAELRTMMTRGGSPLPALTMARPS